MSTDQQPQPPTSPPRSDSSSPATPTGGTAKRNLFGRKKRSATSLGPSPSGSTNNLVSAGNSLKSGQSAESLQDKAGLATYEGPGGKGIMSVFKRKGGKSIGDIEEDQEREAAEKDDDIEQGREMASEDDGVLSYDSETDVTHRPSTAGALSPNTQSPESIPGRPMRAATFSPYDSTTTTTVTAGNKLPELSPKTAAVVDILKAPFRRSTSPITNTGAETDNKNTSNVSSLPRVNTNLPTATPDIRPATSGGESRRSDDRGRRTGRTSVGTSDGSELPLDTSQARKWPGGIITKDDAQPGALLDPNNTDTIVQTTVTPPTPTDNPVHFPPNPKSPVGAVVNKTGQRRSRTNSLSGTPSKLSQIMTAPLTPTVEAGGFAAGAGSPGGGAGSFFQTMFSAAQTAATSFSNTIANTNLANNGTGGRPRTGSGNSDKDIEKENFPAAEPQRRLAVETLGHGELSLGSLGILPSPKRGGGFEGGSGVRGWEGSEGVADSGGYGGEPVSAGGVVNTPISAISNNDTFESAVNSPVYGGDLRLIRTPVAEDSAFVNGGRSDSISGAMTPERSTILATNEVDEAWFGDGDRRRSGSMKSGIGARRKRGSSAASGGVTLQPVPRPTGFAVASKRRNKDFHALFRSVPEDDYLIEDYGCALQKEILLQGRFYVSEGHICFNSNIFGWVNTLVISFDEVMRVEKKSTAMVFPNAIVIQTLHARHVFASFISRDSTYDLIVGIWKISHPSLIAGSTGVRLDNTDPVGESASILGGSEYEEDADSGSDEYENGSDDESYTDAGDGFLEGADAASKPVSRKVSVQPLAALADGNAGPEFPGPATHAPTYCLDGPEHTHYDKQLCDDVIAAPLGQVYSLAFGPTSYPFLSHFLAEEEKVLDIVIPDRGEWKDVDGKKVRSFSYIKPLGGAIGPKQTRCFITETIDVCELENYVSVVVATQTPDVPSGNVFLVKSRYCLMWAGEGATRMVSSCTIEWSGKSWLKGPIEKAANDGQVAYNANYITALKRECLPKEPVSRSTKKMSNKKRKALEAKGQVIGRSVAGTIKGRETNATSKTTQIESWGIFSPLKPYLGPIVDILQSLLNGNLGVLVICVLVAMLVMRGKAGPAATEVRRGGPGAGVRGWEQAWQAEEEGLWEWLEDRSGLGDIGDLGRERRMRGFERALGRKKVGEGMKAREMEEAIGIMEERLEVLRRVIEGRKAGKET